MSLDVCEHCHCPLVTVLLYVDIFYRIARTWKNVNNDHADVKEVSSFNTCAYVHVIMYMYI